MKHFCTAVLVLFLASCTGSIKGSADFSADAHGQVGSNPDDASGAAGGGSSSDGTGSGTNGGSSAGHSSGAKGSGSSSPSSSPSGSGGNSGGSSNGGSSSGGGSQPSGGSDPGSTTSPGGNGSEPTGSTDPMMMTGGGSGGSGGPVVVNPPGGLPAGTPGDPYDLGTLPDGFDVRWPNLPMITQDMDVSTKAQLVQAASTTGTRIHVKAAISGAVTIDADDIEIVMDDGASVGAITVPMKRQRIRFLGGTYQSIDLSPAIQFYPTKVENIAWQIQDVTIDGITIETSPVTGLMIRGDRVAVLRNYVHATDYSLYSDSITNGQNSDIIVAGNNFVSDGAQATLRLISVHNAVVVDNHLTDLEINGQKHNYRIHGVSDHAFGARNILVGAGTMMGTMDGDALDQIYFNSNTFYHDTPDLFDIDKTRVKFIQAHDNVAYTDVWKTFQSSGGVPAAWDLSNNVVHPYMPEPTN